MNKRFVYFIGRFQPPHKGHIALINTALRRGEYICIALRATRKSLADPLSIKHRKAIFRKIFPDKKRVRIISVPDVKAIWYGRGVGYGIEEVQMPSNIESISATQIRQQIAEGNPTWQTKVPKEVAEYIIEHGLLR